MLISRRGGRKGREDELQTDFKNTKKSGQGFKEGIKSKTTDAKGGSSQEANSRAQSSALGEDQRRISKASKILLCCRSQTF
jgi:hypothetical protein